MNKRLITLLTVFFIVIQVIACRFTVREIGFSSLSHDTYSLVIIDSQADPNDHQFLEIRQSLKDSNIKLVILDPAVDKTHPATLAANKANIPFPAVFLMSPDERILPLGDSSLQNIVDEVLYSPIRTHFTDHLFNSFAFVILVESRDPELNKLAINILQQNCNDITDRIPNMPKQVDDDPEILRIKSSDFNKERIWLWALGMDSVPEKPLALVM
ncbi:MAG: hypothetical protein J7L96_09395, partial [Bacteroidales bacterium]|nr:hypothetical protein [Bacteroidales bacterium]